MLFLSEMIFLLEHKTFAVDDFIFYEKGIGSSMYFINKGLVIILE